MMYCFNCKILRASIHDTMLVIRVITTHNCRVTVIHKNATLVVSFIAEYELQVIPKYGLYCIQPKMQALLILTLKYGLYQFHSQNMDCINFTPKHRLYNKNVYRT